MNKISSLILSSSVLWAIQSVIAADDAVVIGGVEMPQVETSVAFEQMKKKIGKWEGQLTQGLTGDVINVSYEWSLVSGGNTLMETVVEDGVHLLRILSFTISASLLDRTFEEILRFFKRSSYLHAPKKRFLRICIFHLSPIASDPSAIGQSRCLNEVRVKIVS